MHSTQQTMHNAMYYKPQTALTRWFQQWQWTPQKCKCGNSGGLLTYNYLTVGWHYHCYYCIVEPFYMLRAREETCLGLTNGLRMVIDKWKPQCGQKRGCAMHGAQTRSNFWSDRLMMTSGSPGERLRWSEKASLGPPPRNKSCEKWGVSPQPFGWRKR